MFAIALAMLGFVPAHGAWGAVTGMRLALSTLRDAPKPELFVAYWDSDQLANYVSAYSRSGRNIEIPFGSFSQAVLVATDPAHNVYILETGRSVISAFAKGSSTPFETIPIDQPAGEPASDVVVDERGDFWVAYGCGGSYCATPGSLVEYGANGGVENVFANCLLSYDAIALDRRGNAYAGGLTAFTAQTTKSALVEYASGGTSCTTVQGNRVMGAWGGGLQVTRNGELVLDFDAQENAYVEILGGPAHRHVLGSIPISNGFYRIGRLALTHDGREIWVGTSESGTWSAQKFAFPGGGFVAQAGYFELQYDVYDFAATD